MVDISIQGSEVHFNVKGLHKLWAFKSQLQIPRSHIVGAWQDAEVLNGWWKGWRSPGTHIPWVLTAGTFLLDEKRIFWDVQNADKAIVIDLRHDEYNQLIIEVEDPAAVIALFTSPA
jgi:hypothetical protein